MTARLVQERLNAAGFGPLGVDGKIGPTTIAALDRALTIAQAEGHSAVAGIPTADPNDAQLAIELERDEAYVRHAYKDSRGYWTIGIGRLIDKALGGGITRDEALYLKRNDIVRFKGELDKAAPWWRQLDPVRQRAVLNMTFNLRSGWITPGHEKAWPNTVALLKAGKYAEAADAIRANKVWVGQVGDRDLRIANRSRPAGDRGGPGPRLRCRLPHPCDHCGHRSQKGLPMTGPLAAPRQARRPYHHCCQQSPAGVTAFRVGLGKLCPT